MEAFGREKCIFEAMLRETSWGGIKSFQDLFREFLSLKRREAERRQWQSRDGGEKRNNRGSG
jgi:hypothetical protein